MSLTILEITEDLQMQFYNRTKKLFANGEVDITNLKVMLTNGYSFNATQTDLTAATAAQVSGNGWTAGGVTIANAAVTVSTTNDAKLDGDDISVTATGGDIGPADGLVVVDATNNNPLLHYSFGSSQTAGDGTPFNVNWDANGILTWRDPV
jgi:hypothetical protein